MKNTFVEKMLLASLILVTLSVPSRAIVAHGANSEPENPNRERSATAAAQTAKETPAEHDRRMQWWRQAKFGMFIHWGLYAVPAGEYQGKRAREIGGWSMSLGKIPRAAYGKVSGQL